MKELNQRVHDLVRFMRQELHQEGLITDEEYALLASDSGAVQRLEDYDGVMARAREAAASKRPSGLVKALIEEIEYQGKEISTAWRSFDMYRNAWLREIGNYLPHKSHEIDAFVLRTRDVIAFGDKNTRKTVR